MSIIRNVGRVAEPEDLESLVLLKLIYPGIVYFKNKQGGFYAVPSKSESTENISDMLEKDDGIDCSSIIDVKGVKVLEADPRNKLSIRVKTNSIVISTEYTKFILGYDLKLKHKDRKNFIHSSGYIDIHGYHPDFKYNTDIICEIRMILSDFDYTKNKRTIREVIDETRHEKPDINREYINAGDIFEDMLKAKHIEAPNEPGTVIGVEYPNLFNPKLLGYNEGYKYILADSVHGFKEKILEPFDAFEILRLNLDGTVKPRIGLAKNLRGRVNRNLANNKIDDIDIPMITDKSQRLKQKAIDGLYGIKIKYEVCNKGEIPEHLESLVSVIEQTPEFEEIDGKVFLTFVLWSRGSRVDTDIERLDSLIAKLEGSDADRLNIWAVLKSTCNTLKENKHNLYNS